MKSLAKLSLLVPIFVCLLISQAMAKKVGNITYIEPLVDVLHSGEVSFTPVSKGDPILEKDIARTKRNGKARIELEDGTILSLAPFTRLDMEEYLREVKRTGVIKLSRGKVRVITPHRRRIIPIAFRKPPAFEVHTLTAVVGIRGSDACVVVDNNMTVAVFIEGEGYAYNPQFPDIKQEITGGEMVCIPMGTPALPPTPASESQIAMYVEDTAPTEEAEEAEEVAEAPEEAPAEVEEVAEAPPAEPEMGAGEMAIVEAPEAPPETPVTVEVTPETTTLLPVTETEEEAIDTTPPTITLTSTPPSVTNSTEVTFDFEADEPATFSYSLDGSPWTIVTAPLSLTDLTEGAHVFEVTATDPAGNTSTVTYTWITDYTAPVISITTSPPSVTNSTEVTFDFEADEPATFSYSLDGSPWTLASPLILTDLTEGIHTLDISATDPAGNVSTVSYEWLIGLRHYTLEGSLTGTGSELTGSVSGDYCGISDENWGGWLSSLSGTYTGTPSPSWGMIAGGSAYHDSGILNGYWLETAIGTDWSDNILSGTSYFTYLSTDRLGIGMGKIEGTYGDGIWQATDLGFGTCTEALLTLGGSLNSVYWASGEFAEDDSIAGLIGATTDLWSGSPTVTLMGTYTNNMPLWAINISGTTTDGGAFLGVLGFSSSNNDLTGNTLALYIGPDGSTGYLVSSGTISGTFYPGLGMWEAHGYLIAESMDTTTTLLGELSWDSISEIPFYGTITDDTYYLAGSIVGESYGISDQDWGIFRSVAGGWTDTIEEGYWIAYGIGSYGLSNYTSNTYGYYLTETALGSFSGNISLSDTATWDMSNAFTETPLTFVSEFSSVIRYGGVYRYVTMDEDGREQVYDYTYGYLDDNSLGWIDSTAIWDPDPTTLAVPPDPDYSSYEIYQWPDLDYICELSGLMGGTQSLWDGGSEVGILGSYYSEIPDHPHVWYNPNIYSYSYQNGSYLTTTYDGGAYYGFTGGIELNNTLEGRFVALYIDPYGYAGYLSGELSGYTYPDIEMFEAYGILSTQPVTEIGIASSHLYENLDWILLGDGIYALNIQGEPWGIYMFDMGGPYTPPEGTQQEAIGEPGVDFYWLTTLNYTASGGRLTGSLEMMNISYYDLFKVSGDVLGTYDESSWQGVSLGTWEYSPLAWSVDSFAGYHYYDRYLYALDWCGWQWGIIGATTSPFASPNSPVEITFVGEAYPYYYITWWGDLYGSYADGSVIPLDTGGWPAGFIGGRTDPWGSMEGILVSLYIDSTGNAGYLKGDFMGNYYHSINMFEAAGTIIATQKALGYDPSNYFCDYNFIDGYLYGSFIPGGAIYSRDSIYNMGYGYLCSYTAWLVNNVDEPWGIFNIELGGHYDYPSDSWTLILGGNYWRDLEWLEYWFAHVEGTQWSDQRIAGTLSGRYLTYTVLGTMEGNVLGSYDTYYSGTWEAIALGTFEETPLAFSGEIYYADDWPEGPYYGIYADNGGYFDTWDDVWSLAGGVTSPWTWDGNNWQTQTVDVVYMGEYYCGDDGPNLPYIWNDVIYSWNDYDWTYTTFDVGSFYGFIGGVWRDKAIDARVVSLYMDPGGNIGYMTGSLEGTYYPEFYDYYEGLFEAEGTWTPTQMALAADVGIDPVDFYHEVQTDPNMTATVYGTFGDGNGYISGKQFYSYDGIEYIPVGWTRYIDGQNWGIYDIILDGYGSSYHNPNIDTAWSAKIGGGANFGTYSDGLSYYPDYGYWLADITASTWDEGKLSGSLKGRFLAYTKMGNITGDVLGYYDDARNWAAVSLGTYDGTPLSFVSSIHTLLRYYDGAAFVNDGGFSGLMGGTQSLWTATQESPALALAMGDYSPGGPCTWRAVVYSHNYKDGTYTTYDDGACYGGLAGIHLDNTLEGRFGALYIAPDPEGDGTYPAGYLMGSLSGTTYPDIGMFEMGGSIYPVQMTDSCTTSPFELQLDFEASPLDYRYLTLNSWLVYPLVDYSGFTDLWVDSAVQSGGSVFIKTEPTWGNWFLEFAGTCSYTEPLESWFMTFSSIDSITDWTTGWYNELQIEGTQWSNNELAGNAQGYFVDLDQVMTGIMVGETLGTFSAASTTTFEALAAGTCIETNTFLAMLGTQDGRAKLEALNIPVTEVYAGTLTGAGTFAAGGSLSGFMNLQLLGHSDASLSGLLAATLSGSYTGTTGNSWSLTLANSDANATITGNLWSGGNWAGTMTGIAGTANFRGAVAGTYNGGSWSGTGAGIWNK